MYGRFLVLFILNFVGNVTKGAFSLKSILSFVFDDDQANGLTEKTD